MLARGTYYEMVMRQMESSAVETGAELWQLK
jgi:hypothetical protein